jgi:hypothetical protein
MMTPIHANPLPVGLEPDQVHQSSNFHIATVMDVKDPARRGRVRVKARSVLDDAGGEKNWSNWTEVCRFPIGSFTGTGDFGMWWAPMPGEVVALGFLGGDYLYPVVMPFSACQGSPEEKTERIPLEAKAISDQDIREGTRIRVIKTEAGHTLLMDDRGGKEKFAIIPWDGSAWFSLAHGKTEDEQEKEKEESKPRKGESRGVKSILAWSSKKPSELLKGGVQITGHLDLNGQGYYTVARDGDGTVVILAGKEKGSIDNYFIMSSKAKITLVGAGKTQIWCDDEEGHVYSTSTIIQNQEPIDVEPLIQAIQAAHVAAFSEYDAKPVDPVPGPPTETVIA